MRFSETVSDYFYKNKTAIILCGLWLIASLINIDKAFHIDDTFHLEVAQWIEQNPLHPMSGKVLWQNKPVPLYTSNHPVLYFYLLAIIGSIFGYSEISLHVFQSLFTALAILYFYKTTKLFYPNQALFLSCVFVFIPGFILNQNLMVDIPLLACELAAFYYLLRSDAKIPFRDMLIVMLFFSAAILIKYTLLAIYPVFIIYILLKKEYTLLPVLLLPLLVLTLWSGFNYLEYGGVHIISRNPEQISFEDIWLKTKSFIVTLGAILPLGILYLSGIWKNHLKKIAILILTILIVSFIDLSRINSDRINEIHADLYLFLYFMTCGILIIILTLYSVFKNLSLNTLLNSPLAKKQFILILWVLSISAFVILFAPFIATRHLLLIMPPVLILNTIFLTKATKQIQYLFLFCTAILGTGLAISDWQYADFYRQETRNIKNAFPAHQKIWSLGHWGWKWYSKETGMEMFETHSSILKTGDILVIPHQYSRQEIPENIILSERYIIDQKRTVFSFLSTGYWAKMYVARYPELPWRFTKNYQEEIHLYWVKDIKGKK